MRLIDLDALKRDLRMGYKCEECERDPRDCQYGDKFNLINICEMLDNAPAVYTWHSPEDIPPQKGIYLVYAKKYFIPDHVDDPDHIWMLQLAYYDEKIGWSIDEVKWWIELPEPPEEG